MHGQNPSWASGKPADRTERERSHSIVIASSAVIDGRADERECRAACVSAKAVARKERKVMPSGRSPVCRRRYVGKKCEVTREVPGSRREGLAPSLPSHNPSTSCFDCKRHEQDGNFIGSAT